MGSKCTLQEVRPSKASWWSPKTKTSSPKGGVIYRPRCGRWIVMMNTLVNPLEHLEKDSRNMLRLPTLYMIWPLQHNRSYNNLYQLQYSREGDWNLPRITKESIYIRVNSSSLNKNNGNYHLPHIWDDVLFKHLKTQIKITLSFLIVAIWSVTLA